MSDSALVGVIAIGLLHGLEPGHGWPVAMLYATRKRNRTLSAILSSSVLGLGHLISSIAVVVAYVLLDAWLDFEADWIKYVAAGILVVLAIRLYRGHSPAPDARHDHHHDDAGTEAVHGHDHGHSHGHTHRAGVAAGLWGLTWFAFLLGFAHEEEFALLALAAGGVDAWALMLSYGIAVLAGLIAVTMAAVKVYALIQPKIARFERYVPRVSAGLLVLMAAWIIIW